MTQQAHTEAHPCIMCNNDAQPGTMFCSTHRPRNCKHPGCTRQATHGYSLCGRHRSALLSVLRAKGFLGYYDEVRREMARASRNYRLAAIESGDVGRLARMGAGAWDNAVRAMEGD